MVIIIHQQQKERDRAFLVILVVCFLFGIAVNGNFVHSIIGNITSSNTVFCISGSRFALLLFVLRLQLVITDFDTVQH